ELFYDYSATAVYTDIGSGLNLGTPLPVSNTATVGSTNTNPVTLSQSIGGLGSASGQLYVSGTLPKTAIGKVNTATNPWGIYKSGNFLYSVNNVSGTSLQIFDVTVPSSPVQLTYFYVSGSCQLNSVMVSGKYAYVADDCASKFYIIDVSNPNAPVLINTIATSAVVAQVLVEGQYAYTFEFVSTT